jgi:lipopolysaccharide transport system ATP-binding protein
VSDTIISVEGLGKKYVLSHQGGGERGYARFSEKLEGWMKKPFAALAGGRKPARSAKYHQAGGDIGLGQGRVLGGQRREVEGNLPPTSFHLPQPSHEEFWALKDVSFEVKRGEVVGIIGRNGAGKSTLLKILSRITEPSEGRVTLRGRVASLLEVGTGFHPELTGRENIYLNGAILGMTKAEIRKKFDEIVAFAEVERFLDTPVKRYSSGMYVRLAFAVAAHLEPEILVVDEVLAVGDAEFQKKCLGKMKDVATGGRTVLFVSHNMQAVKNLCSEAILLEAGTLRQKNNVDNVVMTYSQKVPKKEAVWSCLDLNKKNGLFFKTIETELQGQQPSHKLKITTILQSDMCHKPAFLAFDILDSTGVSIMQAIPELKPFIDSNSPKKEIVSTIELPPLIPGQYRVTAWVGSHNTETLDQVSECIVFNILQSPQRNRSFPHTLDHGHVIPKSRIEKIL